LSKDTRHLILAGAQSFVVIEHIESSNLQKESLFQPGQVMDPHIGLVII
jgi:hypothetical protein